jgi:two-component system sensor histidine kinase YesM
MLALMLIVLIPAILIAVLFYTRLYDMVVSDTIRKEQDASADTSPLIEETIQEVLDASSQVTSLDFYRTLFHMPVNTSFSFLSKSEEAQDFQREIQEIIDNTVLTGVRIYIDWPNESSDLFQSEYTGDIFAPLDQARTYWRGIMSTGVRELYCPPMYLGKSEREKYGDEAYIRSTTMLYQNTSYNVCVALYYSSDYFKEILSENLALEGSVSYIINERNNIVASSDESLSGIYWLDYDSIQESFMSSNNFITREILDQTVYAGFYSINKPGWFMVTVLPSQPLIRQSQQLMTQFVTIYLAFLILALIMAMVLSRSITNRLSSVIQQMEKVKHGAPVPMDSPREHDEVGDLIDTYNYMTRRMNLLMDKQAQAAEDLRIAEFNSLQAQINPHFLYNTMDMINWLAQQGRTSEVSNAVQSLSRFYKLTLSRKQSISTIASEEEHVSIYVHLQNMRYHDSIQWISDIPDELMEYSIPKLTLQPVVENAILHGILEKETKEGTIVLTGWTEDEDIVLLISDDGVGIPANKLPTILSGTGQSSSGGTNIAIYNTHRRLQILYGDRYGLTYSSKPGQGTEVLIRIPMSK